MKSVKLTAFSRGSVRRNQVKKLRGLSRIPAVIYGRKKVPMNLEVTVKDLEDLIHHSPSETILVDLAVDGDASPTRLALVQEIQHHALSGKVLHVDFHEVAADEKVTITVPLETTGTAAGVKTGGGVLEHVVFKIKVRALPKDLPELITVDVSSLEIGSSIHLGEIPQPPGVEILGDKGISVIAVAAPITEVQETEAAAAGTAGAAEPEMIKEKKDEAAGDAKAGDKDKEKAGDKKSAEKKK